MERKSIYLFLVLGVVLTAVLPMACVHDPIMMDPDNPIDTTENPIDTTMLGDTCDPEIVYFEQSILPLLQSSCAQSGCHDAASANDGVILTDYNNIINTADVEAFDLDGSDLYEVITEDDIDKRMPLSPQPKLSNEQINLIANWILQGALNNSCEFSCDTSNVTFSGQVFPIIKTNCLGCHNDASASGGVVLSSYNTIKPLVDNGRLYGAVTAEAGYVPMPFNLDPLSDCNITLIKNWIDEGAQDN